MKFQRYSATKLLLDFLQRFGRLDPILNKATVATHMALNIRKIPVHPASTDIFANVVTRFLLFA